MTRTSSIPWAFRSESSSSLRYSGRLCTWTTSASSRGGGGSRSRPYLHSSASGQSSAGTPGTGTAASDCPPRAAGQRRPAEPPTRWSPGGCPPTRRDGPRPGRPHPARDRRPAAAGRGPRSSFVAHCCSRGRSRRRPPRASRSAPSAYRCGTSWSPGPGARAGGRPGAEGS